MQSGAFPEVAPGERRRDTGGAGHHQGFWAKRSLLMLGSGSRDGERIDCNGPGETAGRIDLKPPWRWPACGPWHRFLAEDTVDLSSATFKVFSN